MPPRRRLTEILTSSRLETKVINLIVEGISDQVIVRSFCEGARIPNMIYPISMVEIDCLPHKGPGGDKARVTRTSSYLSEKKVRRICCIIDRDDLAFSDFMHNSHCLVTDLASLDLYSLDTDDLAGYVSRQFQKDGISTRLISSVLKAAASASILQWRRIVCVPQASMADIEASLLFENGIVRVSLSNWIERSRAKGGSKEQWDTLLTLVDEIEAKHYTDHREFISVHLLDEIFRHWMKSTFNVKLDPYWLEGHLRGMATYERLRGFDFFQVLYHHCANELALV